MTELLTDRYKQSQLTSQIYKLLNPNFKLIRIWFGNTCSKFFQKKLKWFDECESSMFEKWKVSRSDSAARWYRKISLLWLYKKTRSFKAEERWVELRGFWGWKGVALLCWTEGGVELRGPFKVSFFPCVNYEW